MKTLMSAPLRSVSPLSCIDSDLKKLNENIYNRITSVAKDLAKVAGEIEAEYGIPIVNKRISVTPIALIGGAACKTPEDLQRSQIQWTVLQKQSVQI